MDREIYKKQLQHYLKQFYVKPPSNSVKEKASSFVSDSKKYIESFIFNSDESLKQYCQQVILAYDRFIDWECVNSYTFVERFLQGEPIYSDALIPELLIITHGYREMPNRQLHNVTNQIIASRKSVGKKTLLVSLKADGEFDPAPVPFCQGYSVSSGDII